MIFTELLVDIVASSIFLLFGFLFGKYREKKMQEGKNLDEYEFYPFDIDENNNLFFDLNKFNDGVLYLIRNRDSTAARQLILIGEQNNVQISLKGALNSNYKSFIESIMVKRLLTIR